MLWNVVIGLAILLGVIYTQRGALRGIKLSKSSMRLMLLPLLALALLRFMPQWGVHVLLVVCMILFLEAIQIHYENVKSVVAPSNRTRNIALLTAIVMFVIWAVMIQLRILI